MTVTNVQKTLPKLDVLSTFTILNNILRVFGLSCVYRDGAELKWSWPFWSISFIITFFSITNVLLIYFKIKSIDGGILHITFKEALQIIYLLRFYQYFVDILFVYKFGRQNYVDYLKHYECIDDILGVSYYFGIKKSIRNWCVILFILGIATLATDFIAWSVSFSLLPSSCFIDYMYILLKILCVLDMVANFTNMNFRLEAMVDVLEDYYHHRENLPGVLKDVIGERFDLSLDAFNTITFNKCSVIKNMTRCYLLLIQQCDYVNSMYGVRIIVTSTTFLLDMVMMINLLIRFILGTMVTTYGSGLLPIMSTATRIVSYSIILISCVYRCEQNYRQNDRLMRLIDHLLLNKNISSEVSQSLKELRELIIASPVRYHAMNFFKLEYSTLVSIASVIVTYTIILLQNMK